MRVNIKRWHWIVAFIAAALMTVPVLAFVQVGGGVCTVADGNARGATTTRCSGPNGEPFLQWGSDGFCMVRLEFSSTDWRLTNVSASSVTLDGSATLVSAVLVTDTGACKAQGFNPTGSARLQEEFWNPGDDRVNPHQQAPMVIYMDPLDVYAVDPADSSGELLLRVQTVGSSGVIASGTNPYSGQPFMITLREDGKYQLNTAYADGKPYIIDWDDNGEDLGILQW